MHLIGTNSYRKQVRSSDCQHFRILAEANESVQNWRSIYVGRYTTYIVETPASIAEDVVDAVALCQPVKVVDCKIKHTTEESN